MGKEKVHTVNGNVFEAIGFTAEEAAVEKMRVELALEIERFISRKKLTQVAAAKLFEVTQPRISNIKNGKLEEFSIEYLAKMVVKTGKTPRLTFTPRRRRRTTAQAAAG